MLVILFFAVTWLSLLAFALEELSVTNKTLNNIVQEVPFILGYTGCQEVPCVLTLYQPYVAGKRRTLVYFATERSHKVVIPEDEAPGEYVIHLEREVDKGLAVSPDFMVYAATPSVTIASSTSASQTTTPATTSEPSSSCRSIARPELSAILLIAIAYVCFAS